MNLSRKRSSSADDNEITFPLLECWNPMTRVATIAAQVGGERVLCRISFDVLKKKFRSPESEPMSILAENRSEIRTAAKTLIEKKAFEADGSIVIRQKDL